MFYFTESMQLFFRGEACFSGEIVNLSKALLTFTPPSCPFLFLFSLLSFLLLLSLRFNTWDLGSMGLCLNLGTFSFSLREDGVHFSRTPMEIVTSCYY